MNKIIKKGRPKTFNKDQANKIAMENYWKEGMGNISLNEICRRIGESKPSIYREYGGEDGLQLAALELYFNERVEPVGQHMFGSDNFIENLESVFNFLINYHFEDTTGSSCMFTQEVLFPSKNLTLECKKFIAKKNKELLITLRESIIKAIDVGVLNKDIKPSIYTEYIINQIRLIATLSDKKVAKSVLNGMVDLIMQPLKNS